jgi:hypothetical protein
MHGKANGPVSARDREQLETLVSNYDMKQHTRADSRQAGTAERRFRRPLRDRRSARALPLPPARAGRRSASTRSRSAAARAALGRGRRREPRAGGQARAARDEAMKELLDYLRARLGPDVDYETPPTRLSGGFDTTTMALR